MIICVIAVSASPSLLQALAKHRRLRFEYGPLTKPAQIDARLSQRYGRPLFRLTQSTMGAVTVADTNLSEYKLISGPPAPPQAQASPGEDEAHNTAFRAAESV